MPNWKTYTAKQGFRNKRIPYISVTREGRFSWNEATDSLIGHGKPLEAVEIIYDEKEQLVAFRPATLMTPFAYQVTQHANGSTRHVGAKSFCLHMGIDLGETRRYNIQDFDGVIGIDLKAPSSVTTREGRGGGRKPIKREDSQAALLSSDVAAGD